MHVQPQMAVFLSRKKLKKFAGIGLPVAGDIYEVPWTLPIVDGVAREKESAFWGMSFAVREECGSR